MEAKSETCTCPKGCENTEKQTPSGNEMPLPLATSSKQEVSENDTTPGDSKFQTAPDMSAMESGLEDSKKPSEVGESQSVDTLIIEPQYETRYETMVDSSKDSCCCKKSKSLLNNTKSQTKSTSKSSKSRKQVGVEKFTKEKIEKFAKLKENVIIAQKNLADIQEQIRQLERLFEDYDSVSTPQGQVNPAALYKEIMKPQSVPYVTSPKTIHSTSMKTSTPIIQASSKCPPPTCTTCQSVSSHTPQLMFKNQTFFGDNQEKISFLSAVPPEQAYY